MAKLQFSKTKIVATVGPACDGPAQLEALIAAGVDVFRLNMAHGDRQRQAIRLAAIREASRQMGQPVGVLADLAGPKMRLGELPGGQMTLDLGARVRFVRGASSATANTLTTTYEPLVDELDVGDRVLLADGVVSLVVEQRGPDWAECRVVQPGVIRNRQGVNLPGVRLSAPAMSAEDRENARWAAASQIDFVGLSFVRRPDDVRELKQLLTAEGSSAQVIAKIEKPEALDNLAAIVDAADGVMVARGDLGVETDIAEVAVVQKRIIAECHRRRRPVIVATQMLDSMQHSALPTRAEATDVANAILDGADACMLSGETAIGEHPLEAVAMMHRIAVATEPLVNHQRALPEAAHEAAAVNPITEATVHAAGHLAEELSAKLIVVATTSGATALALSKKRNGVPTLGASAVEATLRRMCLYWGVIPLSGAPLGDPSRLVKHVVAWGQRNGLLSPGDHVVMVSGTGLVQSAHNQIVVHEVDEA
jgi:pyruvate kinase